MLLVALLYAVAPFIIATKLARVPSLGTITLALLAVGIAYLPLAFLTQHDVPTVRSTVSLVALGILCTAVAFLGFFALIGEVGPVRAPLFTYVNPIVAIGLGVLILGEPSPRVFSSGSPSSSPAAGSPRRAGASDGRWMPRSRTGPASSAKNLHENHPREPPTR